MRPANAELRALLADRDPELDGRPRAWLAFDFVAPAGHQRALTKREQAQVAGEIAALRHHKALAVVSDHAQDPAVDDRQGDSYGGRLRVSLHVADRLGDLTEDHRP